MTPTQIDLVRQSWALVEPQREVIARLFYDRLFERAPELRTMFKHDMQAQGAKLMATLNVVVVHLDRLDPLLDTIRQLGVRHLDWHVRPEQYDLVAETLQWTLARALGDRFTPDVSEAWGLAYDAVAAPMKAAAYPQPVTAPPAGS